MQTNFLDQQIKCSLLFILKFKKYQKYITSLKGNKKNQIKRRPYVLN